MRPSWPGNENGLLLGRRDRRAAIGSRPTLLQSFNLG
jgi:hypothetical protein